MAISPPAEAAPRSDHPTCIDASGNSERERSIKEKYFVRPKRTGDDKWRRLERLYLLENEVTDCSQVPIEQITGADAVRALVDQTYHFNFILGTRRFGDHLAFCTRLASKILIYRLRRSPLSDAGQKLSNLICAHLEGGEASSTAVRCAAPTGKSAAEREL